MKIYYISLFYIILSYNFVFPITITISGDIKDKNTGEPIPYANIILLNTDFGTSSDIDGHFIIPKVPPNKYSIKVMVIGYKTLDHTLDYIENNIKLYFELEISVLTLDEINTLNFPDLNS